MTTESTTTATTATEPAADTTLATAAAAAFPNEATESSLRPDPNQSRSQSDNPKSKIENPKSTKPTLFPKKTDTAATPPNKSVQTTETTPASGNPKSPIQNPKLEHPEDKLELTPESKPETKAQFDTLKTTAKQLRADLAARDAELATLRKQNETRSAATPADQADHARLLAEHQALKDRLALQDIQSHPDYIAQYIAPRDAALNEAATLLKENGLESPDMHALLAKPRAEFGKAVSELAETLPEFDRATFIDAMRTAHKKAADARAANEKSSELNATLRARTAQRQRDTVDTVWREKLGPATQFLEQLQTDDKATPEQKQEAATYNAAIAKVRSDYETAALGQITDEQAAILSGKAATFDFLLTPGLPRVERMYQTLAEENDALRAENETLRGARSPGQFTDSPSGDSTPQGETLEAATKRFFPNMRT